MEDDKVVAGGSNPTDYYEVVITKDTETLMPSCHTLYVQRLRQLTLVWG